MANLVKMALHSWIVQLVERAAVNRDAFKESGVRVPLQEPQYRNIFSREKRGSVEISTELEDFISDNANLINNNEFDKLFDKAEGEVNTPDYEKFVRAIKIAGIDILPYIKKIPASYFKGEKFKEMKIPSGIIRIGYRAFANCKNLRTIYLPGSLIEVSSNAFLGCDSLEDIYYMGTKDQWKKVRILGFNSTLYESGIHCTDGDVIYMRSQSGYEVVD